MEDRKVLEGEWAHSWRDAIHRFVRQFGLLETTTTPCGHPLPTSHAHALLELLRSPGISQGELGKRLALTKSGISRLVARLEENGRIVRRVDPADGRVRKLTLTDPGLKLAKAINKSSLSRFASLVGAIPAERRQAVLDALTLLAEATPERVRRGRDVDPA